MAIADPTFRQLVDNTYLKLITDKINRPPKCTAKRTSTLSITLNTDTVVTWQAEQGNDLDAMWDGAAATVLTVKTEGLYVVRAQTVWNSTTTSVHNMDITVNGSTTAASIARATAYGASGGHGMQITTEPVLLAINDVLRLIVRTDTTLSLQTSRGGSWLSAQWVGYGI